MRETRSYEALEDVKSLRRRYCHALDSFDADRWLQLFAADGELVVGANGPPESRGTYNGHGELRSFLETVREERTYMRHMVHTPVIDVEGGSATGEWYFEALITTSDSVHRWVQGEYVDAYRRTDDGWVFESVRVAVNWRSEFDDGWSSPLRPD